MIPFFDLKVIPSGVKATEAGAMHPTSVVTSSMGVNAFAAGS